MAKRKKLTETVEGYWRATVSRLWGYNIGPPPRYIPWPRVSERVGMINPAGFPKVSRLLQALDLANFDDFEFERDLFGDHLFWRRVLRPRLQ